METLANILSGFINSAAEGRVEIYNEFALQHEFGNYLRGVFPKEKILFERATGYFFPAIKNFEKRSSDIAVFSADESELHYALKVKYPHSGQYPEQMYNICKNIKFAEQLLDAGFGCAGVVIFADDRLFYAGQEEGIYGHFRGNKPLHGSIHRPTGTDAEKEMKVTLRGKYTVNWQPVIGSLMCVVIEAQGMKKAKRTNDPYEEGGEG